jgi:type IV pilus assembly protein PilV
MKRMIPFHGRGSQQGVGMLEVMIAVLVLAIGILGIAALQAITLKNTGSSAARTQAAVQAYSMLDMIRSDRLNAGLYNTNIYTAGDGSGTPGTMEGWLDGLKTSVDPSAKGLVVCVANNLTCTVGVQWNDTRATGGDATQPPHEFKVTTQL